MNDEYAELSDQELIEITFVCLQFSESGPHGGIVEELASRYYQLAVEVAAERNPIAEVPHDEEEIKPVPGPDDLKPLS